MKKNIKFLEEIFEKSKNIKENNTYKFANLEHIKDFIGKDLFNLLKDFEFSGNYFKKLMDILEIDEFDFEYLFLFSLYLLFEDIKYYYKQDNFLKINEIFENIYIKFNFIRFKHIGLDHKDLISIFSEIRKYIKMNYRFFSLMDIDYTAYLEMIVLESFVKWYTDEGYLYLNVDMEKVLSRLTRLYQSHYNVNFKNDKIIDSKINDIVNQYKEKLKEKNENIAFNKLKVGYKNLLYSNNFFNFFEGYRVFDNILVKLLNGEYLQRKYDFDTVLKIIGIDFEKLEIKFKDSIKQFLDVIKYEIQNKNIFVNEFLLTYLGYFHCIVGSDTGILHSNYYKINSQWCNFTLKGLYNGDNKLTYSNFMEVYNKILNLVYKSQNPLRYNIF